MRTSAATASATQFSWTKLALAAAVGSASLALLGGCDDSHSADKRVRDAVQTARFDQLKGGPENLDKAQQELQKAQAEANTAASTATKAYATAMLAQAEMDAAIARVSDPTSGIDPGQRQMQQLLWEINQLGEQIRTSSNLMAAYQQLEPTQARQAVQQTITAATGGPDNPAWIAPQGGANAAAIPTLTAVKADAEKLQAQLNEQQQHIQALQQQQQQVAQQAAQASSAAENMRGQQGVEAFRNAAGLRKQAADLANQIEVAQAKLIPVQQDLALAQARMQSISAGIEQFQKLGQQLDAGWKAVQEQIARQQQIAAAVAQGGQDAKANDSIRAKAAALAKQAAATKETFDTAATNLDNAVKHFEAAVSAANTLSSDVRQQTANLPTDNPMRKALDTLIAVYNPASFRLGQANAQLALANLQAARAQTLTNRQQVAQKLGEVMAPAKLDVPKELADPAVAAEIKTVTQAAADNYKEATNLFEQVSGAATASEREKNGGRAGNVYALYGEALLARATNAPDAASKLAAARSARDQVLADAPTALVALPAELVPAPTTAPSTAPAGATTGPATAPASNGFGTPAAAPAPAPAPAATTPAAPGEGAAPTTPATSATPAAPAEGATPAPAPATPADGAAPAPAPAAPATPADGAAPVPAPAAPAAPAPAPAAGPSADALPPIPRNEKRAAKVPELDKSMAAEIAGGKLQSAPEWFAAHPGITGGIKNSPRTVADVTKELVGFGAKVYIGVEDAGGTLIPTHMFIQMPTEPAQRTKVLALIAQVDSETGEGADPNDYGQKYDGLSFD